jgi:hypothetical protein
MPRSRGAPPTKSLHLIQHAAPALRTRQLVLPVFPQAGAAPFHLFTKRRRGPTPSKTPQPPHNHEAPAITSNAPTTAQAGGPQPPATPSDPPEATHGVAPAGPSALAISVDAVKLSDGAAPERDTGIEGCTRAGGAPEAAVAAGCREIPERVQLQAQRDTPPPAEQSTMRLPGPERLDEREGQPRCPPAPLNTNVSPPTPCGRSGVPAAALIVGGAASPDDVSGEEPLRGPITPRLPPSHPVPPQPAAADLHSSSAASIERGQHGVGGPAYLKGTLVGGNSREVRAGAPGPDHHKWGPVSLWTYRDEREPPIGEDGWEVWD